jgi:peptide-methionine (R)-S-oxide reductase
MGQERGMKHKVDKPDEQWKAELTPEQYQVLRKAGTERPFTGQYVHVKDKGVYRCAGCGAELFASETKYDSGTGWPSFYQPIDGAAVEEHRDWSMLVPRTEIRCASCGGHLGHVFDDGPQPTGQRYCMNSCALKLERQGD